MFKIAKNSVHNIDAGYLFVFFQFVSNGHPPSQQRSPDKKYRIKSVKNGGSASPQHSSPAMPNNAGDLSPPQVLI
jgi:hypothetical protein